MRRVDRGRDISQNGERPLAFDALFDGFERLEHLIRIRLIEFEDVEPPFRYYVGKLAAGEERATMKAFLEVYEFDLASQFLDRFDAWLNGRGDR